MGALQNWILPLTNDSLERLAEVQITKKHLLDNALRRITLKGVVLTNEQHNGVCEMQELKENLDRNGRRHAMRLISAMEESGFKVTELVADRIHKEMSYCSKDAYRLTMKNRNGETENDPEGKFNR